MLDSIDLNDKSFEQIRDEAIAQIPIYSNDWTNYNISDPGITILENFAAFLALQQSEINEVPDKIKKKLLGLAGFTARKGNAAQAYVLPEHNPGIGDFIMPKRAKLYAQDICFETYESESLVLKDISIKSVKAGEAANMRAQQLLKSGGAKGGLMLWGERPRGGEEIYLYIENLPCAGTRTAVYFGMAGRFARNRMEQGSPNPFVSVKWELLTANGFEEFEVCDETCGFLQSGHVLFALDEGLCRRAIKDEIEDAYAIRAIAERADYDIAPCFQSIRGLLMHVVQRDTKSDIAHLTLSGKNEAYMRHALLKDGYMEVYGGSGGIYRQCCEGTHYRKEYIDCFTAKITFLGAAPQEIIAALRDESVMAYRNLGTLHGYDDQIMELPIGGIVYQGGFSAIVAKDGVFHIVEPQNTEAGEVRYTLNEKDNTLIVHDCGRYEGASLILGNYAVYKGSGGNILAGAQLLYTHDENALPMAFENCTDVSDGRFEEDCARLQSRFARDVRRPVTMVTQKDCESIVRDIPGLSIHKIGVFPMSGKNEIHITVKPNSHERHPRLSKIYADEISRHLEKYRMLTTKIVISQPVYVPINVAGIIYAKKHFERCKERIETLIRKMLDGVGSDAGFGSRIVFHEIFKRLGAVEGVEQIYELSIFPDSFQYADMAGMDITLAPNALYYPGSFRIEFTDAKGGR